MEPDPSLLARIAECFSKVVVNWKGLVAGLSLAIGFLPQLFPPKTRPWLDTHLPPCARQWLDRISSPEPRRRVLIRLCLLLLLVSFFQVYDDVSTTLRHVSFQLPDFEKAKTWSVSFEIAGVVSGGYSEYVNYPFFLLIHGCKFSNMSVTQKRILDLKVVIRTNDPQLPEVTLDTENMPFAQYRKEFADKGMAVDERVAGRKEALLQTPIVLEPNGFIEETIEVDILDRNVKQKVREQNLNWWIHAANAEVSVTDQRSNMTRTIKVGRAYNAATGAITAAHGWKCPSEGC